MMTTMHRFIMYMYVLLLTSDNYTVYTISITSHGLQLLLTTSTTIFRSNARATPQLKPYLGTPLIIHFDNTAFTQPSINIQRKMQLKCAGKV